MKLIHRTAQQEDEALLLSWRNSSSVREFSLNPGEISISQHAMWFANRLQRSNVEPFIFFILGNKTIGTSRLDLVPGSSNEYEISILIDSEFQGKRLGTKILQITLDEFFNRFPEKKITARIHKKNVISLRLFQQAGFEYISEENNFLKYQKKFNPVQAHFG